MAVSVLIAGIVSDYGLLQVKEGELCAADDKGGNVVQLRGMSFYWSNWGAAWWNESAVDQSVDWLGCQIIRAPMSVGSQDSSNNPIDVDGGYLNKPDANMTWVKTVVDEAIYKDIYVIIDWHDHAAETHQEQALVFFTEMARIYGNRPNVIFEIYNEPITRDWDGTIKPYAETVINAIRSTISEYDGQPARNVIIVGTPFYSQLGAAVVNNPLDSSFTNIAYALHFYAASHNYSGGTSGLGKNMLDALNAGLCVIATEWGTVLASGSGSADQVHSQEWVDAMNANNVTWCNWSINDKAEGASMFNTGTTPLGPWEDADLTASGVMVKGWLPVPTTQISVSPSLVKFFHMGGTQDTTLIRGSYIEAVSDQPGWLSVSPTSGTMGQSISITASPYTSTTENRTGNIVFTDADGNSTKVKVVQLLNDGNLALGKNAVASSTEGSYVATNVTDGDENTTRWSSEFSDPQWIYVDLGEDIHFNAISLIWEAAYSKHFILQVAPNGTDPNNDASYMDIFDSGIIEDGKGSFRQGVAFSADRIGRYIRLLSLERTTINGSQYGVSLYEIKVYADRNILVLHDNITAYAGGLDKKIDVVANVIWTATSSADWLTIDPTSGGTDFIYSGSHPVIHCAPNYEGVNRTAYITFTGGDASPKTLTVTQPAQTGAYGGEDINGNPVYIRLFAMAWARVDNPDGSTEATFRYQCNDAVSGLPQTISVLPQADWLTITSFDSEYINIHATPNTTDDTRTGLIIIKTNSYPCLINVWVIQDPYVEPQQSQWTPSGGGDQQNLILTFDGSYTAASSNTSWLNVTPTSGTGGTVSFYISASSNTTGSLRTATVTINGGGVTKEIQVTQDPVSLVPSPKTISVSASGGTKSINITSNVIWWSAYTTDGGGWLSINTGSYSGVGDGTIYFTVSKNTTGRARTATITIIGGDVPTQVVTITQSR